MTDAPPENPPAVAASANCEHYWAYLCFGGLSVRQCQFCHGIDWAAQQRDADEIRAQGAAAERARILALAAKFEAQSWQGQGRWGLFSAIIEREAGGLTAEGEKQ